MISFGLKTILCRLKTSPSQKVPLLIIFASTLTFIISGAIPICSPLVCCSSVCISSYIVGRPRRPCVSRYNHRRSSNLSFFLSRVSLHFPNHVFSASPIDNLVSIHFVLKIRRPLSLPRPVSSRVSHLSVFFIVHDFVIALYLRPGYNRANKCECRHFR